MSPQEARDAALPRGQSVVPSIAQVHFDGACDPPRGGGVATYGFVVEGPGLRYEEGGLAVAPWAPTATNNVAEYTAAIRGLEWLLDHHYTGVVLLVGDSQLVIRQLTGEYEVRAAHLREYHNRLRQLMGRFHEVRPVWVPREENQRADQLSKVALADAAPLARRLKFGPADS
ncbi:MAG TPA: ribonuclease HI [Thermoplasmata archaeon]|nr:ribonuclease HI [Thermoplasmata archaeon]